MVPNQQYMFMPTLSIQSWLFGVVWYSPFGYDSFGICTVPTMNSIYYWNKFTRVNILKINKMVIIVHRVMKHRMMERRMMMKRKPNASNYKHLNKTTAMNKHFNNEINNNKNNINKTNWQEPEKYQHTQSIHFTNISNKFHLNIW